MMKKLYFEPKDYTVEHFKNWFDKGKLITNPDYQRDYIYPQDKASRLIESALMLIPLPTIYLCEEDNDHYSVIDGQQRIMSFIKFSRSEYELKGLTYLTELNGKKYKDLDSGAQNTIDQTSLRTIIIKKESADAKYDIFERLNRGAVTLKEQELRNCVFRGAYNDLINQLAKDKDIAEMFLTSENKRMSFQENILRFFALRDYFSYSSSMKKQLNDYMRLHQNDNNEKIEKDKKEFKNTLSTIKQVLGIDAFKTVDYEKKLILKKFSPTFYDSIMIAFTRFDKNKLIAKSDELRKKIVDLKLNNDDYHIACYAATGSRDRVIGRILHVCNAINDVLGVGGFIKEKRAFPQEWKEPLAIRQKYICPLCGNKIVNLDETEIDHIDPYSLGGSTTIENAQLVHTICNRSKSNKVDVNSIAGRPTSNQKVINLSDDVDLSYTKPDYLMYKNKNIKVKNWDGLYSKFFELIANIDSEKINKIADNPPKTKQGNVYISHNKNDHYKPVEVIPGVFIETSLSANHAFRLMKNFAKEVGLDASELSFSLVLESDYE